MDGLRKPLFFLALLLIVVAVLLEIGGLAFTGSGEADVAAVGDLLPAGEVREAFEGLGADQQELQELAAGDKPPGLGVPYLALLDGVLLFTVGLVGAGVLLPEAAQARAQGLVTLGVAVVLILAGLAMIAAAIGAVTTMLALLAAVPFGTLTYLAIYGFFNRAGAAVILGFLLLLKLGFGVSLALAQPRFLQNRGLVALLATSIAGNLVVSFLHGLAPGFLVSLTDAIAAIVIAALALLWLLFLLLGSGLALYRLVRPG
jgi:hypothetical protein